MRAVERQVAPGAQRSPVGDLRYTVPETQGDVLRRQRLLDFLYENIDRPLQLICAPAGYGKTTLLADFARDTDLTVCWYSVDPLDSDPSSFVLHLTEAVRTRFPAIQDPLATSDSLPLDPNRGWQSDTGRLLDWIREHIPEYFVLVIDDFHILSDKSAAADVVDFLLQRVPENCRLIFSSRETPQLSSLPRLMSQRKVSGLGPAELKFTATEIRSLLRENYDLDVTEDEARRLELESEGWITSILLTTHSLWSGIFREALVNRGPNSLLFDYMAAEVFAQETLTVQQFLLSTSVCNEFNIELGDVLTSSHTSADILKELENRNLFINRLGGTDPWYRYHHLFRDFLRETLKSGNPDGFALMNIKAAQYYLATDSPRQAIQHYIQGSEFDLALELLEEEAESLSHEGLWETLSTWLDQIPVELQYTRPKLHLYLSRAYQLRGRNDDAIQLLNKTIETFREEGVHTLEAQALMRRSVSLRFKGEYQMAIRDSRQALRLARTHGTIGDQADARSHLGTAYGQQGQFSRAEREFKAALKGYQGQGNLFQLSEVHERLGTTYSDLGDTTKAVIHFELARQGLQKLGNQSRLSVTINNMSHLYYQQGQYETAEPLAWESISLAQAAGSPRHEAYALMTLADIQRETGDHAECLNSYRKGLDLARECMEMHLVTYGLVALGDTHRLNNEPEKAKSFLEEALAFAEEGRQDFEAGLGRTSLGIIEYEAGNLSSAESYLVKATEHLSRSGQKRAMARTRFHLGQVLFLSKKYGDALEQMESVALICGELGYDRFLATEGRRLFPLIQYAAGRCKNREFFARLMDQLQREPAPEFRPEGAPMPRPGRATVTSPRLEVCALGPLRISMDGKPIYSAGWSSSKAREMFLYLLHKEQPVHKEKIVESVWAEISSAKVNSNFHSTLYRIRAALYPSCVVRDGESYQLNPEWTFWSDAKEFQRNLKISERLSEDDPQMERLLSSAIELYQGPFAEDIDSEWCNELRTELELDFLKALADLAELQEGKGEYQQSITLLEQALAVDELQEEIYYKIMDLHIRLNDQVTATRVYSRCLAAIGPPTNLADGPKVRSILAHLN